MMRDVLEAHVYSKEELEVWELHFVFGVLLGFEVAWDNRRNRGKHWYSWLLDKLALALMWASAGALFMTVATYLFDGFELSAPRLVSGVLGLLVVLAWDRSFRLKKSLETQKHEERMEGVRREARENIRRLTENQGPPTHK